jgi:hypothetical protein
MGKTFLIALLTGIMFVLPALVAAEETTLTNKDLEKYRGQEVKTAEKPSRHKDAKSGSADKAKEQKEQEQWCKRATALQRKVEKAKDAVADAEKKLAALQKDDVPGGSLKNKRSSKTAKKTINDSERKLQKSRKELSYTERDLSNLEQEAQRKGIPPGWLRCQFN